MTSAVAHRGPDGDGIQCFDHGEGQWRAVGESDPWQLAFGHRRLAILDVSDAGRQPMSYRDRLWITYNGEVYNYLELRRELASRGHEFRTGTDTEVILAAYLEWGSDCFARFRGMWGLAIVDLAARRMVVCRDRLGIKPLYRLQTAEATYFASEIKQFATAGITLRPHDAALSEYLLTGYEPGSATLFENVVPIPAGTWAEVDLHTGEVGPPQSYWRPESIRVAVFDRDEAARLIRESLAESCRLQLRSDVPVGCALSGGLDSSSIASLVATCGDLHEPLNTFTVSFPGTSIDESHYADLVIRSAAMQPHVVEPTAEDFLNDLDRFVWMHDEPPGSLSQYAAYALARLMRGAGVPVTLNGQGGDETLLGYWQSYLSYLYGGFRHGRWLTVGRHIFGSLLPGGNPELIRQLPIMWRRYRTRVAAADRLGLASLQERAGNAGRTLIRRVLEQSGQERRICEIRELHLPRLLKWDDRNLMAFSVEGRYPFLDHEFIAVALSCDESALYHRGWTKEPLRRGMSDLLPHELLRRTDKNGFETPQAVWLCGPLRGKISAWLGEDAPLWSYVPSDDVRRLASLTWDSSGENVEAAQALMRMFFADRWLRVFFSGRSLATPIVHTVPA